MVNLRVVKTSLSGHSHASVETRCSGLERAPKVERQDSQDSPIKCVMILAETGNATRAEPNEQVLTNHRTVA